MMTLSALASKSASNIVEEAGKRFSHRELVLKHANLKIHEGRQRKHIEFINGKKNSFFTEGKSILEHTDPEKLVKNYAGKGIKDSEKLPGMPGYKEIVNFKEFIGYNIHEKLGEKTATTWGKIHYAKDGVHIVPTIPRD